MSPSAAPFAAEHPHGASTHPQLRLGPSPRQDFAEEEEDARPLSRDELTARTIRGLHKREANETKYREQRRNTRLVANKGQL